MVNITNRQRLEQEGLIDPDADLTSEENDAVESLTSAEVDALISAKYKLEPVFGQSIYPRFGLLVDR